MDQSDRHSGVYYWIVQIRSLYPPSQQICFWQGSANIKCWRVSVVNIRRVFLSRSISVFIRQFRILQEAFSSVGACSEQLTSLVQCRSFVQHTNSFRNAEVESSSGIMFYFCNCTVLFAPLHFLYKSTS